MKSTDLSVPEQLVQFAFKKPDGVLYAKIIPADKDSKKLRLQFDSGVTYAFSGDVKHPAEHGGELILNERGEGVSIEAEPVPPKPSVQKNGRSSTYRSMNRL